MVANSMSCARIIDSAIGSALHTVEPDMGLQLSRAIFVKPSISATPMLDVVTRDVNARSVSVYPCSDRVSVQ
jgi:hypothetical protein